MIDIKAIRELAEHLRREVGIFRMVKLPPETIIEMCDEIEQLRKDAVLEPVTDLAKWLESDDFKKHGLGLLNGTVK